MPISPFDDYPIHQTAVPLSQPATGDPNHYDRYWFNGYDIDADWYVGVAMGRYPNRGIIDGAFSLVRGGVQNSVFASGRAPADPSETRVGPVSIEVLEPLGRTRVTVDADHLGITADLIWRPRTQAVEEPRQIIYSGDRPMLDNTRFTQWGMWEGTVTVDGEVLDVSTKRCRGTKDRSWGLRPIGDQVTTAPSTELPGLFFLWSPVHWEHRCTHAMLFERADGRRHMSSAVSVPVLGEGEPVYDPTAGSKIVHGLDPTYEIEWRPGTRRMTSASFTVPYPDDRVEEFSYEPLLDFQMKGIGYTHPEWGHGRWHGESAEGRETWVVADLDPADISNFHVQQVCRVICGDETGIGVLEQLAIGPHHPTGLHDFMGGYQP